MRRPRSSRTAIAFPATRCCSSTRSARTATMPAPFSSSPIQKRDVALREALEQLEGRVAQRTAELEQEITERKRAERALFQSQELYRLTALNASDLLYVYRENDGKVDWFGQIDRMLGFAEKEFPRTREAWERRVHPDDLDRVNGAYNKSRER